MRIAMAVLGLVVALALVGVLAGQGRGNPPPPSAAPPLPPPPQVEKLGIDPAPYIPDSYPSPRHLAKAPIELPGLGTLRALRIESMDPVTADLVRNGQAEISPLKTFSALHFPLWAVVEYQPGERHPLPCFADCQADQQDGRYSDVLLQYLTTSAEAQRYSQQCLVEAQCRLRTLYESDPAAIHVECVPLLTAKLEMVDVTVPEVLLCGESFCAASAPDMVEFHARIPTENIAKMRQAYERNTLRSVVYYTYASRRVGSATSNSVLVVKIEQLINATLDHSPLPGGLNQDQLQQATVAIQGLVAENKSGASPQLLELLGDDDGSSFVQGLFEMKEYLNTKELEDDFTKMEAQGQLYLTPTQERSLHEESESHASSTVKEDEKVKSKGKGPGILRSIFGSPTRKAEMERHFARSTQNDASSKHDVVEKDGVVQRKLKVCRLRRGELNAVMGRFKTVNVGAGSSSDVYLTDTPISVNFTAQACAAAMAYQEDIRPIEKERNYLQSEWELATKEYLALVYGPTTTPPADPNLLKTKADRIEKLKGAIADCDKRLEEAAKLPLLPTWRQREQYRAALNEHRTLLAEVQKAAEECDKLKPQSDAQHAELSKKREAIAAKQAILKHLEERMQALLQGREAAA